MSQQHFRDGVNTDFLCQQSAPVVEIQHHRGDDDNCDDNDNDDDDNDDDNQGINHESKTHEDVKSITL